MLLPPLVDRAQSIAGTPVPPAVGAQDAPGADGTPGVATGVPAPPRGDASGAGRHLLTVALEDYFQVGAFNRLIQRGHWSRFETRVESGTQAALDLLARFDLQATFFVSGWIAEHVPEIVRRVAERGHEVASFGYHHRSIRELTPGEFRDDLARAREALQDASGQRILGYRVPRGWLRPSDLWVLDALAEEGYAYDSSVGVLGRRWAGESWRRFAHVHRSSARELWEFPPSAIQVAGWGVPVAGGNWMRQLPGALIRRAVARWDRLGPAPFVMYFHTWELDPDQPMITAAPLYQRLRQYRNLNRMPDLLRYYFRRFRYTSIAGHLGLDTTEPRGVPRRAVRPRRPAPPPARVLGGDEPTNVTIVIPCYNEELILPYLANTLARVRAAAEGRYALTLVFVDDCSRDGTWAALHRVFGDWPEARFVQHAVNRGVAGGILTGLEHATTETACSMDCDCTYDPLELLRMIPLLEPGVDMVTASPYHPEGGVRNVPGWRLALSRSLSALYRRVLRHKLRTYTSCFRVYRRSAVSGLPVTRGGFLGVAEMLGRLDLAGGAIVEYPTVLEVRMLGRSKMKLLRTILGHLFLLGELAVARIRKSAARPADRGAEVPG